MDQLLQRVEEILQLTGRQRFYIHTCLGLRCHSVPDQSDDEKECISSLWVNVHLQNMSEAQAPVPPPPTEAHAADPNCPQCHGTGEKKPGKPCKACRPKSSVCSKCNGTGVIPGKNKPCKCAKKKKHADEAPPS